LVIEVSAEQLFGVVTDFAKYTEFIPELKTSRVLSESGATRQVEFELELTVLGFVRRIRYTLEFDLKPPTAVDWRFISGEVIKDDRGGWTLKPLGPNRTEATYKIDVELGAFIPKSVSRFLTEQSLPKLLDQFKVRAEALAARKG
jgi:ribosome-associated toxin RatA of RatAB toxin-antitoxin module